jgi:hypothetical protein
VAVPEGSAWRLERLPAHVTWEMLADFLVRGDLPRPSILDAAAEAVGCGLGDGFPAWQAAYRAAAQRHHPDQGGEDAEMQRVNVAWALLKALAAFEKLEAERGIA